MQQHRVTIPLKETPVCPLDATQDVQQEFARLLDLMGDRAASADSLALLMLATSWTTWRKATAEVARLGLVVMSGGCAISNPNLAIAAQAHNQVLTLCRELGLTPSARRKLGGAADKNSGLPKLREGRAHG